MKKILTASILGQQGINLIERYVLDMGFTWTPTGALEAGIDGIIETRDAATGQVYNTIIQVQSKAVSQFHSETDEGFNYWCRPEDLEYWMHGNAPVILVVSRPDTNQAYWVSIKTYFADPARKRGSTVHFRKKDDRFGVDSRDALFALAAPRDAGLYLSPQRKHELLHSNLLEVCECGPTLFIGETVLRHRWQVNDLAKSRNVSLPGEWELWEKKIISLHDLNDDKWDYICDAGTVESFSVLEWLLSEESGLRNQALSLLHRALRRFLRGRGLDFDENKECFFFRAKADLRPYKFRYLSLSQEAARTVFQHYPKKLCEGLSPSHYRHSACKMVFSLIESSLFLELTPTWYFTSDGVHRYRYFEERLKGIKKLEKNAAILGQLVMWAELLAGEPELFEERYPFLRFGKLQEFPLDRGILDTAWLPKEDEDSDLTKELSGEQEVLNIED
jgi:hypothetical protein